MPTIAEDHIAAFAAWLASSSKDRRLWTGDTMKRGPYGDLVHVGIDDSPHADLSSVVAQGVLPIFTPQAIDVAADDTPPEGQDIVSERVAHVIWKARNAPFAPLVGFPPVIVVGVPTDTTTIRAALASAGLEDPDLDARGVLALPLYAFPFTVGGLPVL